MEVERHVRGKQAPDLGAMPSVSWAPGWHLQVCLRGSREVHLYPKQLPDWLVRATSSLFERGDALAPAQHLWATTSGPAPEEVGARISRWGHTCTHSAAGKGALAPTQAVSPTQTPPPHQHRHSLQLLVLLLQLGLHLAQPILNAAMTLSRLSAKNSISSARNDPVLTARGL